MIRVRELGGVRFTRLPGEKQKAGRWVCESCKRRLADGVLRRHVAEAHGVATLLAYLATKPGACEVDAKGRCVQLLASQLGHQRPTVVSILLADLEYEGLLERDVRGRQTFEVRLTDAGRKAAGVAA